MDCHFFFEYFLQSFQMTRGRNELKGNFVGDMRGDERSCVVTVWQIAIWFISVEVFSSARERQKKY